MAGVADGKSEAAPCLVRLPDRVVRLVDEGLYVHRSMLGHFDVGRVLTDPGEEVAVGVVQRGELTHGSFPSPRGVRFPHEIGEHL